MTEGKQRASENNNLSTADNLIFSRQDNRTLLIRLAGSWKIGADLPASDEACRQIQPSKGIQRVVFETDRVTGWDSSLVTFLIDIHKYCSAKKIVVEPEGLPSGVQKLIGLATAVPERKGARKESKRDPFLVRIGTSTIGLGQSASELLAFIGEAVIALAKFLVGMILAFVGAVQLKMFGAQIFVANLVGIAMVRVLAAVMAGVVMAGRTGAAGAAQLGTMQVNEEIDALKTMGVSPMEFLVLPRMLALVLMMPLLCIFADLMGLLGGLMVGVGLLDIGLIQYLNQTQAALNLNHFFIGIFQAAVFGILVALAGCLKGMACGRSASAVGDATTSAVVTSIIAITVATAIITVVCNVLHI